MGKAAASSADRIFAVLEGCARGGGPLTLAELVQRTGLPKTTLHRTCWKLVELGALEHRDGRFRVGAKLFALGGMNPELRRLRDASMPYLHELCRRSSCASNLAVLNERRALLVEEVYGAPTGIPRMIGASFPLHCTGLGKALMAGWSPDRLEALLGRGPLRPLTRNTIVRPDLLAAQLATVAREGVAFSHEEWRMGISSVAAPVVVGGEVAAALAVVGKPDRRLFDRMAGPVRRAARMLGESLAACTAV